MYYYNLVYVGFYFLDFLDFLDPNVFDFLFDFRLRFPPVIGADANILDDKTVESAATTPFDSPVPRSLENGLAIAVDII